MQYSPKLKRAMEKIKDILKEEDIAALVVLYEPGFVEHVLHVSPTFSGAYFEGDLLRAKISLADYSNYDEWKKKSEDTAGMFYHMGQVASRLVIPILAISEDIDRQLGSQHGKGDSTSNEQQLN